MNPKYNEYMKPILEFLLDGKTYNRREIVEEMVIVMNLSEEDMAESLPSRMDKTYKNRISWALTYLKKASLVLSPSRGLFNITKTGKVFLKNNSSKKVFTKIDLNKFPSFNEFQSRKTIDKNKDRRNEINDMYENDSPEDIINKHHNEMNNVLINELLQEVLKMSPGFFEKLVLELLEKMGYGKAFGTPYTNDQGIDGIVNADKLGLEKIYVQAKRYNPNHSVGRPDLNSFVGAMAGQKGSKGIFITTSSFSNPAINYAKSVSDKVVLIDGEKLGKLMIEYNVGVQNVHSIKIKKIDLDYFED